MDTLTPYATEYVRGRLARGEVSASTAKDYRWTLFGLTSSYGNRPVEMFGPAAIDRWLESISVFSDSTRREYLSRVRCFGQWLVATKKIRTDPTAHVPPIRQARRVPRTLQGGQVGQLLRAAPDKRATAILWLMVGLGCRCCEVSRLRVEDYDPIGLTVTLIGKAGHERTLPVPDEVAQAVGAYLDETGVTSGPLIRSELHPYRGLSPKTLSGYVRGWMVDAGVKARAGDGRSAHALRRTCASDVLDGGADIRVVQSMLGHERLETTSVYLRRVTMEQMRGSMSGRAYSALGTT